MSDSIRSPSSSFLTSLRKPSARTLVRPARASPRAMATSGSAPSSTRSSPKTSLVISCTNRIREAPPVSSTTSGSAGISSAAWIRSSRYACRHDRCSSAGCGVSRTSAMSAPDSSITTSTLPVASNTGWVTTTISLASRTKRSGSVRKNCSLACRQRSSSLRRSVVSSSASSSRARSGCRSTTLARMVLSIRCAPSLVP